MGYSAAHIANHFLDAAKSEHMPITHLKLQKLVYLAHGWYLGITEDPLIEDEYAEAWQHGPVFPSLYQLFKTFRNKPIKENALAVVERGDAFALVEPRISPRDHDTNRCLDRIWEVYKHYTAGQLSSLTHQEGSPWHQTLAKESKPGRRNINISDVVIMNYYKSKLSEGRDGRRES